MAIIRMQNFIEDNEHQANSVELMASWQAWLSESQPFVILDSGSNSLKILQGSFFTMKQPFRWYRIVEEDSIVTQAYIDVGGNFKENQYYYLYLVDDTSTGSFIISEQEQVPSGLYAHEVIQIARFSTQEGGVIRPNSIYDSQMRREFEMTHPIGTTVMQYPHETSPQERMPFLEWQEISQQYAGDFLRIAGGLASAFGSGRQADSSPNITGTWGGKGLEVNYMAYTGSYFEASRVNITSNGHTGNNAYPIVGFDASLCSPSYGRREEVAPQNQTVRLWMRKS
ncbi:hypothetical protein PVA45_07155 (plasmid) [Entomospira entomophila]|uniref:Major tropism determinant second domain-containing protein n=1 Tax=Entomospira entomophila TaxID=2719988 RepID=A0A968GE52_9SPIO|nr:hypothetical protein [Entomospira entomophilus]NIZ41364.1 hypothetical protein [Entomospira entomophilus]WDI36225.1 hypothetical protein PVA45_07155 [Entomospira entomophilus]